MTTMIERVARAIAVVSTKGALPPYHIIARAAIEAMREPTQKMIDIGVEDCDCWEMSALEVDDCFRTMIDAALNEK